MGRKEARTSTRPLCQEVAYPKFWKLYSKNYKNYSSAFVFYALLTAYGSALTYEFALLDILIFTSKFNFVEKIL